MPKLLTIIFLILVSTSNAQINCDSIAIAEIVNRQLKIADNYFGRPFVLKKSSMPFDTASTRFKPDSTYIYTCHRYLRWDDFNVQSKYGTVQSDTIGYLEYSLYISSPMFNKEINKCRLVVVTHFSEFCSSTRYFFYKKAGKKWKFVKQTLLSIS